MTKKRRREESGAGGLSSYFGRAKKASRQTQNTLKKPTAVDVPTLAVNPDSSKFVGSPSKNRSSEQNTNDHEPSSTAAVLRNRLRNEKKQLIRESPAAKHNVARFSRVGSRIPSLHEVVTPPHLLSAQKTLSTYLETAKKTVNTEQAKVSIALKTSTDHHELKVNEADNTQHLDPAQPALTTRVHVDRRIVSSSDRSAGLGGSIRSVMYDRIRLPPQFNLILDQWEAVESAFAFVRARQSRTSISSLIPVVEQFTSRSFSFSQLRKIQCLIPEALKFLPPRGCSNAQSQAMNYEIVLLDLEKTVKSPSKQSRTRAPVSGNACVSILERRELLHRRLLKIVSNAHSQFVDFVKSQKRQKHGDQHGIQDFVPLPVDINSVLQDSAVRNNDVLTWDSQFDLSVHVPDIIADETKQFIARSPVKCDILEAEQKLRRKLFVHGDADDTAELGVTPAGAGSVPEALLELVRRRESERKAQQLEDERRHQSGRVGTKDLVRVADLIRSVFRSEKRNAMDLDDVQAHVVSKCADLKWSQEFVHRAVKELAQKSPDWISVWPSKVDSKRHIVRIRVTTDYTSARRALFTDSSRS